MATILKTCVVFLTLSSPLFSQDFGVRGHTFNIEEDNLLDYLQIELKSFTPEETAALEKKVRDHYLNLVEEPTPVAQLREAVIYDSYFFDPTITVSTDIEDHQGNIIVSKGTVINPLTICRLQEDLIFFDATKDSHLKWAKQQKANAKWVLVKGRPLELMDKENRPVFFDQFGFLTKKFGIQHIPAKVSQDGLRLKIEEIPAEAICEGF